MGSNRREVGFIRRECESLKNQLAYSNKLLADQKRLMLSIKDPHGSIELWMEVMNERHKMIELLNDARLQIEYLHNKYKEIGSGNAVLARLSEYTNLIL